MTTRGSLYPYGLPLVVAMAGATNACTLPASSVSVSSKEAAGTNHQAISGGQQVNEGDDTVSSLFPLSTVTIHCIFADEGSGQCTGELISPVQILTAAHCCPAGGTVDAVYQYNATRGNAAPAAMNTYTAPYPIPVIPPGVTGGGASGYDSSGNYADLALIALPAPLQLTGTPVLPGFPGSYPTVRSQSLWEVGSGLINNGPNPDRLLEWTALGSVGVSDTSGQFSALNATTNDTPGCPGDSGGPVYQTIGSQADGYALLIVGVTSYVGVTADGQPHGPAYFTSVLSPTNRTWIMNNYVAAPTPQEVQRNRQFIDPGLRAPSVDRVTSLFPEISPESAN